MIGVLIILWWFVRTAMYWYTFRFRKITATLMTCLIIAGAPVALLILFIFILPLTVPEIFLVPASIGLAIYLMMHYTRVSLLPDGLIIPLGVELISYAVLWNGWKIL